MRDLSKWSEDEQTLLAAFAKAADFHLDMTDKVVGVSTIALAVLESKSVNRHAFIEKANDCKVDGYDVTFMGPTIGSPDEYDAVGDHFYSSMSVALNHINQHLTD